MPASPNHELAYMESSDDEMLRALTTHEPDAVRLKSRLAEGDRIVCLTRDTGEVVSWGWMANRRHFPISEIGLHTNEPRWTVLYDFYTLPSERGRGHYTRLLREIVRQHASARFCIYALASNAASVRAIERVGFRRRSSWSLLASRKLIKLEL